uniref:Uncharacterized protein n=1 Tax=Pararge aegeria TaxID=116150 RepID=S4PJ88_9NEOP
MPLRITISSASALQVRPLCFSSGVKVIKREPILYKKISGNSYILYDNSYFLKIRNNVEPYPWSAATLLPVNLG